MFEKAFQGSRRYWAWLGLLLLVVLAGSAAYARQLALGLGITGLSRDVSWGLYIAQFTFLVGVAASAVTVILPYTLHDVRAFGRITILGELLAIAAVLTCLLFVFVDMGQPGRILNVLLHPSPRSVMFWDMVALTGYLALNAVAARVSLGAEWKQVPHPRWLRVLALISIPWAVSIHTVTAFLYSGLSARPFWMTAILTPRFLASAFASGPALLILLCLLLRRLTRFDAGQEALRTLAVTVTYAMVANVFFLLLELFTALYAGIPEHVEHLRYLFLGLHGDRTLVPWTWTSEALAVLALALLLRPRTRGSAAALAAACGAVFVSVWIEKGLGLVVTGFTPSPLGAVSGYLPTLPEVLVAAGAYGTGLLMLTLLFKIAVSVREST